MIKHRDLASQTTRAIHRGSVDRRRLPALMLIASALVTAVTPVAAQAPAGPEVVIPVRIVLPYNCFNNIGYGCSSIDEMQEALQRGNGFWAPYGIRFWIKSVEYYDLPLMKQKNTTLYPWWEVRDEIRTVFPEAPVSAFYTSEHKQGAIWMVAATAFWADPTEVTVFVNDGGSSGNGPWGGRLVWMHNSDFWSPSFGGPPTTFPHELGHFLGLQHPNGGPGNNYHNPKTGLPYSKCDFWDQVYQPGSPPQFFASSNSPGCNGSRVSRIGNDASVTATAPFGQIEIELAGKLFDPFDWETQLIAAPTGLPHNPPQEWSYSLNLMGGFKWSPQSASIDGSVPRHLSGSQVEIVYDFLTYEHPFEQDSLDLILREDDTLPLGTTSAALSSQRTQLGKADDDFFWWSNGMRTGEFSFAKETKNLGEGYLPVAGDFDGDGNDDLFWYRPANGKVTAWWSNGDSTFDTVYYTNYSPHARPFAGDFDGNGKDDLYYYVPGSTSDVIAYGTGNRQFWHGIGNVHATWEPFSGDFDGDQDDDIVWLDPLADTAVIWWSDAETLPPSATGTNFTTESGIDIGGPSSTHCRRPVVGNFDNSYGDDVFWYCAGTGSEKIWRSNGTKSPTKLSAFGTMAASVDGFYRPFAGDFDGDGYDDIFWDDSTPSADAIWAGGASSPVVPNVHRTDLHGFFQAISGDFDGDGDTDVFFYRDGAERWVEAFGSSASAGSWQVDDDPRTMADVDGDGRMDVVGFDGSGVKVSLSTGDDFTAPAQWSSSYGAGWNPALHPRLLGDVDNDGDADVVGFGNSAVWVARSTGSGFSAMQNWVGSYGSNQGWAVEDHPRVLADVSGDGRMDIVGFANPGVYVSLSTGSSFTSSIKWVSQFGTHQGWQGDRHPRHLADVDGDGRADVVGFGNGGVWVARSLGLGFTAATEWVDAFGYNDGWRVDLHPRFVTDVNGDGRADVVGLEPTFRQQLLVSLSTGTGFTAPTVWVDFGHILDSSNANATLAMDDVNGDGKADAIAFGGDEDTYFTLSTGTAFTTPRSWIDQYGADAGWDASQHLRTLGDVDGDGRADLVGFGGSGVWVRKADFCFAG